MFFDRSAPEDLTFFCKSLFFLQKCGYNISVDGWFDGSWMIFLKHFSKLCQCIYPREGTATRSYSTVWTHTRNAFIPARGRRLRATGLNGSLPECIYPREGTQTKTPPQLEHSSCGGVLRSDRLVWQLRRAVSPSQGWPGPRPARPASWGQAPSGSSPQPAGSAGYAPHPAAGCARFAGQRNCRWRG